MPISASSPNRGSRRTSRRNCAHYRHARRQRPGRNCTRIAGALHTSFHAATSSVCLPTWPVAFRCTKPRGATFALRNLGRLAKPSREDRKRGLRPPVMVGGVTFALGLSQAFDTVSRQDIIDQLHDLAAMLRWNPGNHHRHETGVQVGTDLVLGPNWSLNAASSG